MRSFFHLIDNCERDICLYVLFSILLSCFSSDTFAFILFLLSIGSLLPIVTLNGSLYLNICWLLIILYTLILSKWIIIYILFKRPIPKCIFQPFFFLAPEHRFICPRLIRTFFKSFFQYFLFQHLLFELQIFVIIVQGLMFAYFLVLFA